jgi:hypothetical protein
MLVSVFMVPVEQLIRLLLRDLAYVFVRFWGGCINEHLRS